MTTKAAVYKIDAARLDNHTRMNLINNMILWIWRKQ